MNANTLRLVTVLVGLASMKLFAAETDLRVSGKAIASQSTRPAKSQIVFAVWYRVPPESLARRRGGKDELTAAHNSLPLGTLVRVTSLRNQKSAVVRITDRGITNRRAKIDICKEAAEELGILSEGIARVRLDFLPELPSGADTNSVRPTAP